MSADTDAAPAAQTSTATDGATACHAADTATEADADAPPTIDTTTEAAPAEAEETTATTSTNADDTTTTDMETTEVVAQATTAATTAGDEQTATPHAEEGAMVDTAAAAAEGTPGATPDDGDDHNRGHHNTLDEESKPAELELPEVLPASSASVSSSVSSMDGGASAATSTARTGGDADGKFDAVAVVMPADDDQAATTTTATAINSTATTDRDGILTADGRVVLTGWRRVAMGATRAIGILATLWAFLFALDLMGTSFKILGGKAAGNLFELVDNPVAGLVVGVLATVLVQSSSTSTSIVVGLVASGLFTVQQAVPVIMGANIGTSVTNTIVAMGQIERKHEFTLAFAGATVHDFFNLFCVAVLLPLEILVGAITGSGGYLYMLSKVLTEGIGDTEAGTFTSPLKLVVAPAVKLIISADKNKIKALSLGEPVLNTCLMDDEGPLEVAGVSFGVCGNATQLPLSQAAYRGNVLDGSLVKGGAFEGADDAVAGTVSLILSLAVLCGALYLLVKQLRSLVMATAEKTLRRAANVSGPVAMLIGAVVTIAVQSSSVTTSAFTPLVGIGVVTLEQMFPVTLGANIGTTCTALLASMVTGSTAALQIALCHLLFNVTGILLFYPVKRMRELPLKAARAMGSLTNRFPFVAPTYILTVFVVVPFTLLGLSALIASGNAGLAVLGVLLLLAVVAAVAKAAYWWNRQGGSRAAETFIVRQVTTRRAKRRSGAAGASCAGDNYAMPTGAGKASTRSTSVRKQGAAEADAVAEPAAAGSAGVDAV